jgi:hypothetical protein
MTSRNVTHAQAFLFRPEGSVESLSFSVNFRFDNGGTKNITSATFHPKGEFSEGRRSVPLFTIYFIGGRIDIYREGGKKWSYELNGEPVETEAFDPWAEHDRVFIEACQSGDTSQLRNDYEDGLGTIGPLLAAIESNRTCGHAIEMSAFLKGS